MVSLNEQTATSQTLKPAAQPVRAVPVMPYSGAQYRPTLQTVESTVAQQPRGVTGPMDRVRAALGRVAQRRAPLRAQFLKLVQRHAVEAERRGLRFKPETLAAIDTAVRSEAAKPTKA